MLRLLTKAKIKGPTGCILWIRRPAKVSNERIIEMINVHRQNQVCHNKTALELDWVFTLDLVMVALGWWEDS